ncbi:MAG: GntR family transcriptional regulator [Spirochaetia bacterium]
MDTFKSITIDKASDVAVYRQIIDQITRLIQSMEAEPGDKLPTERDLAERLGIARGTITKAYEELERNRLIDSIQGRGSFVAAGRELEQPGRKNQALTAIDRFLDHLEELKFTNREIRTLIDLKILEREERRRQFNIAAVDCNPEALEIYQRQLGFIPHLQIKKILLDELVKSGDCEQRLKEFELILTTEKHYSEVLGVVPGLKDRLLRVAVALSQDTVISLAGVSSIQRIGIMADSIEFINLVKTKLKDFQLPLRPVKHRFTSQTDDFNDFIADRDVIILPPGRGLPPDKEYRGSIQDFTSRGGKRIYFEYQLERGSLLYVEERIKEHLNSPVSGM